MKKIFLTLATILVVLSLVMAYKLFFQEKEKTIVYMDKNCDLHKNSCKISFKNGINLEFSINPKEIPLLKKITYSLKTTNITDDILHMKIYATNMNMGEYNIKLQRKQDGLYESIGMLPRCIAGNMIWNAEITIKNFKEDLVGIFSFKTGR